MKQQTPFHYKRHRGQTFDVADKRGNPICAASHASYAFRIAQLLANREGEDYYAYMGPNGWSKVLPTDTPRGHL